MTNPRRVSTSQYRLSNSRSDHWTGRRIVRLVALVIGHSCLVICFASPLSAEPPIFIRITDDGHFKQRPAWSPDGKTLVFARHQGATIFLFLRDLDGVERRLTDAKYSEYDAVFSPDGQRLLFSFNKASPNQGDIEVYSIAGDGSDLTPVAVTRDKLSHEEWACWSPDGQRIAYTSTRDGNQELYTSLPDGTDEKRLTSDPAIDAHPAWSPDGTCIAFATNRWGDLEIATVDPEGKNLTRLTESGGLDDYPAWSPDGKRLAFTSNRDGNFDIYVASGDGSQPRNATQHPAIDNFPSWSPDGRLTIVSNRDGGFDIFVASSGE